MTCGAARWAPAYAEVLEVMKRVWEGECQKPAFARRFPRLCAAAMVAALGECGRVVRRNFWIKIEPRVEARAVVREAARLAGRGRAVSVRALVVRAVKTFLEEVRREL
ncbi:MAG: hypothetical protein ACPL3C_08715 [Pyrobaculum sp.]